MKKFPVIVFVLLLILSCYQFVQAQAASDETRQSFNPAFGEADDETKFTAADYKSDIYTVENDFYKGVYTTNRKNDWIQTKDAHSQIKFLEQTIRHRRSENFIRKASASSETSGVDDSEPKKFNFQPIVDSLKDADDRFFFRRTEFSAAAANDRRFYNNSFARRFDLSKESGKLNTGNEPDETNPVKKEKFHWKPALIQSGIFLGIQHGVRIWRQEKTSRELGGPFFQDWFDSVKNLRGWDDGNKLFTNYVAHPLQGAFTGRIFVNNSDRAKKQEIGKSKTYWESRLKAMAWTAVWSTQFELGPISEASIGNVGMYDKTGRSKLAWGDLVVTPIFGTALLVGEDWVDKYVLKNWIERKAGYKNTTKVKILRTFLTPTTSLGNLIRLKVPWKRDNRLSYQIQTADQ